MTENIENTSQITEAESTVETDRAADQSDQILEIHDARVTFDMDRGESRVLNDISLTVYRNEVFGIVGESGSGKSMLASSLLDAVVDPGQLSGEIIYHPDDGEPVDVLELDHDELMRLRWEEISMVFQGAMGSFNPTMTIEGHFLETLDAHDVHQEVGMERAHELLSDLYLDPDRVLDAYPHELSGGMTQRALIALSLVLEPAVLVMDEPTAALDLLMQRSIISLLGRLQEKYNLTMLFITHDLPLVTHLSDRIGVMYAFELVELGSTRQLLNDPGHPYTRALLNSTPSINSVVEDMKPIPGSSPDPVNIPSGCTYHPRCPMADETCKQSEPEFAIRNKGHRVACFHHQAVDDQIPLTIEEDHR